MKIAALGTTGGWHLSQLQAAASSIGAELVSLPYESLQSRIKGNDCQISVAGDRMGDFQAVLARTMPLGSLEQITFRLALLHALAQRGVPVINPPRSLEICIDKFATLELALRLGIPVPQTIVCQNRRQAIDAFHELGGDVVVKPLLGSEGQGLIRITDVDLVWRAATQLEQQSAVIYLQKFVPPGGRDLRILFAGDQWWCVRRTNPDDWRTNHRRGATTTRAELPEGWDKHRLALQQAMHLEYGAIDLTGTEGEWQLLEVNAIPGWKGAQSVLDDSFALAIFKVIQQRLARPSAEVIDSHDSAPVLGAANSPRMTTTCQRAAIELPFGKGPADD